MLIDIKSGLVQIKVEGKDDFEKLEQFKILLESGKRPIVGGATFQHGLLTSFSVDFWPILKAKSNKTKLLEAARRIFGLS